jgi:hypothetical protein
VNAGRGLVLGVAAALLPAVAATAGEPRANQVAAIARPNLSGFWTPSREPKPDPVLMAKLPANTAVLDDAGYREFPQGEFGGLMAKPDALAAAMRWKPEDEVTLSRTCAAPSVVYLTQGPFPFEIHQTPELIVLKYEYYDMVRLVFMDGRGHPPTSAPHSKTGHSIGRWEGDELVVDTTHLSPATITNNGLNHSARLHLVERYKLGADGKTLFATQWFEDPEALDNNGARYMQWDAKPGEYVLPYDCDPSFAVTSGMAPRP